MTKPWVLSVLAATLVGCAGEREVVVTRAQFGPEWPLQVNSARVMCSDDGFALVQLGTDRYALDPEGRARGYPDAKQIVRELPVDPANPEIGTWPADPTVLMAACESGVKDVAAR